MRVFRMIPAATALSLCALFAGCVDLQRPPHLSCPGGSCLSDAAEGGDGPAAATDRPPVTDSQGLDLQGSDRVSSDVTNSVSDGLAADAAFADVPARDLGGASDRSAISDGVSPPRFLDAQAVDRSADSALDSDRRTDLSADLPADVAEPGVDAPIDVVVASPDRTPDIMLQAQGTACGSAGQCNSGFCQQGFCCDRACTGVCESCGNLTKAGMCTPVPDGELEIQGRCPTEDVALCGLDGRCNGNGACRSYPSGTTCRAAACTAGNVTGVSTCDGVGNCRLAANGTCLGYACASTTSCRTGCSTNAECTAPNVCAQGTCRAPKALGVVCGIDAECGTGNCEQGVCCNTACTGVCYACNLAGSVGACIAVPFGGAEVQSRCANQGAGSCGTNGTCDGAGACSYYLAGSACGTLSCTAGVVTVAGMCSVGRTCSTPATVPCLNFICDGGTNACKTSCGGDNECVAPAKCVDGQCGGIQAEFYEADTVNMSPAGNKFMTLKTTVVVKNIDIDWMLGGPAEIPGRDNDFAVRFTGKILPRFTESYTFTMRADDGFRVWIGDTAGAPVMDNWVDQGFGDPAMLRTYVVSLQANQPVDLKVEYYEREGGARIMLEWQSPTQVREAIPTSRLRPP